MLCSYCFLNHVLCIIHLLILFEKENYHYYYPKVNLSVIIIDFKSNLDKINWDLNNIGYESELNTVKL